MSWTDLLVLILATSGVLEIWRHGSLFAELRARLELHSDRLLQRWLLCTFCLSPWVALLLTVCYFCADSEQLPSRIVRFVVWSFAVARAANLLNDLTHTYCRTPRTHYELSEPDTDPESQK